ncbi:hypothetical protein B0T36_23930 [Nocardia donostiensis]|uniref:hypothetical protein n=1 Tax=Nocardia donostiensis TaxID=1538463 RepID=UPI0009DAEABA|nr:hypothetical protein [Nocardia donostiensis]OQS12620.1 hypothetical protein B0T36_23930 [Nocardia donostiensis]
MRGRLSELWSTLTGRISAATDSASQTMHDTVDDARDFVVDSVSLFGWTDDDSRIAFDSRNVAIDRFQQPTGRIQVISLLTRPDDIAKTRDWLQNTDPTMARQFHFVWPTTLVDSRQQMLAVEDSPQTAPWWDPDSDDLPVFVAVHGSPTGYPVSVQDLLGSSSALPYRESVGSQEVATDGTQFGKLLVAMRGEIDAAASSPHSPIVLFGCNTGQRDAEAGQWAAAEVHKAGIQRDVYASSGIVRVRPTGKIVIEPTLDDSREDIEPAWTRYPWRTAPA